MKEYEVKIKEMSVKMNEAKLIQCIPHGIKCDNPDCDYRDNDISFKDYAQYINCPCPQCGENLLTEKCMDSILEHMEYSLLLNDYAKKLFPHAKETDPKVFATFGITKDGDIL